MYDVIAKSTIFGFRNADKVLNTNDKGRVFADVGQFTNAVKTAAQLDNAIGKGAQAAINAMGTVAKQNKALEVTGKAVNWASKNVNPLLIGASGYRVLISDDKETTLKREVLGMSSMFAAEGLMKDFFKTQSYRKWKSVVAPGTKLSVVADIVQGIVFVLGSIAGSTIGYKIGKVLFPDKKKKENGIKLDTTKLNQISNNSKTAAVNTTAKSPEVIDNGEYFALQNKEKTLA